MFACKVILQRGPGWRLLDEDLVNVIQCQSGGSLCSPRKLTHCRGIEAFYTPCPLPIPLLKHICTLQLGCRQAPEG